MSPLAIALTAVGLLALLTGLGWWAFSRSRKRVGRLEAELELWREQGRRNAKADEIMAEPTNDPSSWYERMRKNLSGNS